MSRLHRPQCFDMVWYGILALTGVAVYLLAAEYTVDWALVLWVIGWAIAIGGACGFLLIIIGSFLQRRPAADVLVTCSECGSLFNPADPADATEDTCPRCAMSQQHILEMQQREEELLRMAETRRKIQPKGSEYQDRNRHHEL